MVEETDYNEIIDSLHKLADWVEKDNNVQYFMDRIAPKTQFLLNRIRKGSDTMMKAEL